MKQTFLAMFLILFVTTFVTNGFTDEKSAETEFFWDFKDDAEGWAKYMNMDNIQAAEGCLKGHSTSHDPAWSSPEVSIEASKYKYVMVRMKIDGGDKGQIFWATEKFPMSDKTYTFFSVIADNNFHEYIVDVSKVPTWSGTVIALRLDPVMTKDVNIEVDWIKLLAGLPGEEKQKLQAGKVVGLAGWEFEDGKSGGWLGLNGAEIKGVSEGILKVSTFACGSFLSPVGLKLNSKEVQYLTVRMRVTKGVCASLIWNSGSQDFAIYADNKFHTYNINLSQNRKWKDEISELRFVPTEISGAEAGIDFIRFSNYPQGPADLHVDYFLMDSPINRAGNECMLFCIISNSGGVPEKEITLILDAGKEVIVLDGYKKTLGPAELIDKKKISWKVRKDSAGASDLKLELRYGNEVVDVRNLKVNFTEKPVARPAIVDGKPYVPEPVLPKTDYNIGIFYFPGWRNTNAWRRLFDWPNRKPVLGYYFEGEPEICDWQVKWMLEHGISWMAFDWYWIESPFAGYNEVLENGFLKSRYFDMMKFCLLWCNHWPKTHSEEDCLRVTRYWLDNYFKKPNYLKINNKPVVILWNAQDFTNAIGKDKVKSVFEKMDELCKKEGFGGIFWVMNWMPDEKYLNERKEEGYGAFTSYGWGWGVVPQGEKKGNIEKIFEQYRTYWNKSAQLNVLPLIAPIWAGWEPRARHNFNCFYFDDLNPENFKNHLKDCKRFMDENKSAVLNKMAIAIWNELDEGTYIEPTREFGFGYLDAIREVFTSAPSAHTDITPKDVGMGPYLFDTYFESMEKSAGKPEPGLLAYWTFDESKTENLYADYSGNDARLMCIRRNVTEGVKSNALQVSGRIDGGEFPDGFDAKLKDAISIEAWVKTENPFFYKPGLFKHPTPVQPDFNSRWILGAGGGNNGYRLGLVDGRLTFHLPVGWWSHMLMDSDKVPLGRWVYVVGTCDGETMCLYVDGIEKCRVNRKSEIKPGGVVCIGGASLGHTVGYFDGAIDEVRIYNRGLSPEEIRSRYQMLKR